MGRPAHIEKAPISLPPLISTLTSSKLAKAARDYAKNGYSQKEADDLAASLQNTDTTADAAAATNPRGFASTGSSLALNV